MSPPRASVVVVSRHRPRHLRLCLTALSMQDHPDFEILLVADPDGLAQRPDLPVKRIGFDRANISQARNLGIAQAAGAVIAFIDDDSVAEPGWLSALCAPFADPAVIAATGWTRDRDGFAWQTRSQRIHASGLTENLPAIPETRLLPPPDSGAVSTLGTNCAFRAGPLREIGGFDPVFVYHLDESDVNMRLSAAFPQGLTAIVPPAQVIHARAGSERRSAQFVPRDLTQQGRSAAIFARRHGAPPPDAETIARERRRLLRHMLAGREDPLRVGPLLDTLRKGLAEGHTAPLPAPPRPREDAPPAFLPARTAARDTLILGGWHWQARTLRARAAKAVAEGRIVTLILLTPTLLPHRLRLTEGGWFEQHGGLWGASIPGDSPFTPWRLASRLQRERKVMELRRNLTLPASVNALCLPERGFRS